VRKGSKHKNDHANKSEKVGRAKDGREKTRRSYTIEKIGASRLLDKKTAQFLGSKPLGSSAGRGRDFREEESTKHAYYCSVHGRDDNISTIRGNQ